MSSDENFSMKLDRGGRTGWPLPPSSVFKCKEAKPWINPELFRVKPDYMEKGVMVIGEFDESVNRQAKNCYTISESDEVDEVYSEPFEVYGLPLPNTKIKMIEYSNNPEKGIDTGDEYFKKSFSSSSSIDDSTSGGGGSVGNTENSRTFRENNRPGDDDSWEKGNAKKKRWPRFTKSKHHSWRLFY